MQPLTEWTDHDPRLLVSPPELKVVNANTDTLIINYKFVDEQGNLNGAELPGHIVTLLDDWPTPRSSSPRWIVRRSRSWA